MFKKLVVVSCVHIEFSYIKFYVAVMFHIHVPMYVGTNGQSSVRLKIVENKIF
jgi:hypothetical protein